MRFLSLSVVAACAVALSELGTESTRRDLGSRALKQATRNDVVRRASQTRPKRATTSAGVAPTVGQTFVLMASAPGNPFDGKYGQQEDTYYLAFDQATPGTGNLYSVNQDGNLVRNVDGQFAYTDDTHTGANGNALAFVVFQTASAAQSFGNIGLDCSISPTSAMTCTVPGDPTQNQLLVCENYDKFLAIGVPGNDYSLGCTPATIYAVAYP